MVTAAALGLSAIGITDRNTLAVVRAHVVAKQVGIRLVVGARLDLEAGVPLTPTFSPWNSEIWRPPSPGGRGRNMRQRGNIPSPLAGGARAAREGVSGTDSDIAVSPSPARVRSHPPVEGEGFRSGPQSSLLSHRPSRVWPVVATALGGRQRAPKGECRIWLADLLAHGEGQLVVALPPEQLDKEFSTALLTLINNFRIESILPRTNYTW